MKKICLIVSVIGLLMSCKEEKPCIDQSKIDPNGMCTFEFKPVCGCDGKTYSNKCVAEKAGLTSWKEGSCEEK